MSLNEIGRKRKCAPGTVRKVLVRHGVEIISKRKGNGFSFIDFKNRNKRKVVGGASYIPDEDIISSLLK